MEPDIITVLTSKDDKYSWECAEKIISESQESDDWYEYFDEFASLLSHPKSFVRNRALIILSTNARWDSKNRFGHIMTEYLSHITDEKPITARQCIKSLIKIGQTKSQFIPEITVALRSADLSQYKDSMRPLIEKDISEAIEALEGTELSAGVCTEKQSMQNLPENI